MLLERWQMLLMGEAETKEMILFKWEMFCAG